MRKGFAQILLVLFILSIVSLALLFLNSQYNLFDKLMLSKIEMLDTGQKPSPSPTPWSPTYTQMDDKVVSIPGTELKRYINNNFNFSFDFPSFIDQAKTSSDNTAIFVPAKSQGFDPHFRIHVYREESELDELDKKTRDSLLSLQVGQSKKFYENEPGEYTFTRVPNLYVNGIIFTRFKSSELEYEGPGFLHEIYFVKDENSFHIWARTFEPITDEVFEEIIKSFNFST